MALPSRRRLLAHPQDVHNVVFHLATVATYALAFWLLSLTLRTIPVGIAYATWSGLGMVLIALAGWWLYGQRLDGWALLGMALVVAGVLVMNLLSPSSAH